MGAGSLVTGGAIAITTRTTRFTPLTVAVCDRRVKSLDCNVVDGDSVFGVGQVLSGICPGTAYASVGIGNYPILIAIAGLFVGACVQVYCRELRTERATGVASADAG